MGRRASGKGRSSWGTYVSTTLCFVGAMWVMDRLSKTACPDGLPWRTRGHTPEQQEHETKKGGFAQGIQLTRVSATNAPSLWSCTGPQEVGLFPRKLRSL